MADIDWALVERYLANEATPEERARVEAWLAEDPDHWTQFIALREARARAALSDDAVEEAKADVWGRLAREMGRAGEPLPGRVTRRAEITLPPRRWSTGAQIAAAALLTVGAATVGTLVSRVRSHSAPPVLKVATTARGQRATFRLPDGTHVMLGVASTLRYPASFGDGPREVSLEGEAYFEVVHNGRSSFVVHAGTLIAKDLGTQFTVRSYPGEADARVVVREGRVGVRAAEAQAGERVVTAGQLGSIRAGVPLVEPADTAALFAWTQGRLVLDRTPLRDALPELGRWFDLDFRLADTVLGDVPLTATLTTQPTPDVLDNLAASLGMRQQRVGRTVTLYADSGR